MELQTLELRDSHSKTVSIFQDKIYVKLQFGESTAETDQLQSEETSHHVVHKRELTLPINILSNSKWSQDKSEVDGPTYSDLPEMLETVVIQVTEIHHYGSTQILSNYISQPPEEDITIKLTHNSISDQTYHMLLESSGIKKIYKSTQTENKSTTKTTQLIQKWTVSS